MRGRGWRLLVAGLLLAAPVRASAQALGQPLPAWTPGYLDIHHIGTGQGNATFCVLPDGTTLLIDAGAISPLDWRTQRPRTLPTWPDSTRRAGAWVGRYILRVLAFAKNPVVDYALLTHFHDDHLGSPVRARAKPGADYKLTGITEVAEFVAIRQVLDRGWPDYAYPRPLTADSMMANYQRFLAWQRQHTGMKVSRFEAGSTQQIRLLHQADKYRKLFAVSNLLVNGNLKTGKQHTSLFPELANLTAAQLPTENMCSAALKISYGPFDYFSAGDTPGRLREGEPAWHDVETPLARAAGPVDVQLLNHHGYEDSENDSLLAALRPRVLVIPAWDRSHPAQSVLERIYSPHNYPGDRDVFITGLLPETRAQLGTTLTQRLKNSGGHVMVRVAPGGKTYRVIVLDNRDEEARVSAVHGPYQAH